MSGIFTNKTLHVAGSCSKDGNPVCITYAHSFVKALARMLLAEGAHLVTTVDKIAAMNGENNHIPIIFCWDILEELYNYAKSRSFSKETTNIAVVVATHKSLNQINTDLPSEKKAIWDELCSKHVVVVHRTPHGWSSGASRRERKESFSDAFIAIGGGEGVEHLSHLYTSHGKPVLPLDIPVGSSCADGRGGATYLSQSFESNPEEFIPNISDSTLTQATALNYEKWKNDPDGLAHEVTDFLSQIVSPQVFYVRLMNETERDYPLVENFFINIITPFVLNMGYTPKEIGKSKNKEGFLNLEIFKGIKKSAIIIADMTGLRPNCCMELGYALGLNRRVILTAMSGTKLIFDADQIPCFFWNPEHPIEKTIVELKTFWEQNIDRGPLVS